MHPWRERLDRWFAPAARWSPLSPNQITLLALVMNLAAAVTLGLARFDADLFLVAPAILGVGGLLDAFDGIVARVRDQSSRYGDFLDHLFDRISDSAILAGFLYGASINPALGYAALIAVIMTGYTGTQIEATYHRRSYQGVGRGEYVIALVALPIVSWVLAKLDLLDRPFARLTIVEWLVSILTLAAILVVVSRISGIPPEDRKP